jgi:steroid 5-alpha reductase family enzyme
VLAYATGRATDRFEAKDWLWPLGPVINAWWSSVGRRVAAGGVTLPAALSALSRPERLLLAGVTLWGGRLFYRLASRSARRDSDEPRDEAAKKSEGAQSLWNKAFFTTYLPEAAFQTIISLPFSATFRHQGPVLQGASSALQSVAIGLFGTGLALEVLADWQLEKFKQAGSEDKICREGVWSIVRHPKCVSPAITVLKARRLTILQLPGRHNCPFLFPDPPLRFRLANSSGAVRADCKLLVPALHRRRQGERAEPAATLQREEPREEGTL